MSPATCRLRASVRIVRGGSVRRIFAIQSGIHASPCSQSAKLSIYGAGYIEEIVHQWVRAPDRAHFRVRAGAGVQALAGLGIFLA
jgi:hypothetical protein